MKRLLREGTLELVGWIGKKKGNCFECVLISGKRVLISSNRVEEGFSAAILKVYDKIEEGVRDAFRYSRKSARGPEDAIYYRKALRNLLEYLEEIGVSVL